MKLVHCKKCGAAIVTEDALLERMQDMVNELAEKQRKCKRQIDRDSYAAQIKSITKMMTGIRHHYSQMEERKTTVLSELSEITHFILANNRVTPDELDVLRKIAREKADKKNKAEQAEIERIYGEYKTTYDPFNRSNSDKTANQAIRHLKNHSFNERIG